MQDILPILTTFLKKEITKNEVDLSKYKQLSNEELEKLFALSNRHGLAHIVADALVKSNISIDTDIKQKFDNALLYAMFRNEQLSSTASIIRQLFDKQGIDYIFLKGMAIKRYYPEPWMRNSVDIDILIRESDKDKVIPLIKGKLGCISTGRTAHDVSIITKDRIALEFHYSLVDNDEYGYEVLSNAWDNASRISDSYEYVLKDNYIYLYHIAHMVKHIRFGGCGIRPFVDLWLLNNVAPHSKDDRQTLLKRTHLDTFDSVARGLSEYWLTDGEGSEIIRQLASYVVSGGTFGTIGNFVAIERSAGSKSRHISKRLWLPYDKMVLLYPSLKGKKILLPIYQLIRIAKVIFSNDKRYRARVELKASNSITKDKIDTTKNMLEKLGL